jgi:hypothetical protein
VKPLRENCTTIAAMVLVLKVLANYNKIDFSSQAFSDQFPLQNSNFSDPLLHSIEYINS